MYSRPSDWEKPISGKVEEVKEEVGEPEQVEAEEEEIALGLDAASEEPIKIELSAEQGPHQRLGEPVNLAVRITNVSDEPVWVVGVLPGSEGLRYPQYTAEIEGPSGPVEPPFREGLDYARGLRSEDFVRLRPGESFDPQQGKGFIPIQQLAWFQPSEPGTYRLRLCFDATDEDPRQWMGQTPVSNRSQVERLIGQVPQVAVWSNTLELEIEQ